MNIRSIEIMPEDDDASYVRHVFLICILWVILVSIIAFIGALITISLM